MADQLAVPNDPQPIDAVEPVAFRSPVVKAVPVDVVPNESRTVAGLSAARSTRPETIANLREPSGHLFFGTICTAEIDPTTEEPAGTSPLRKAKPTLNGASFEADALVRENRIAPVGVGDGAAEDSTAGEAAVAARTGVLASAKTVPRLPALSARTALEFPPPQPTRVTPPNVAVKRRRKSLRSTLVIATPSRNRVS
ncbi:MAG: hypothetical protein H7255_15260 [Ramlibacter sp.]|nr:hypothetical protein [Ramlibacter sp.]